MSGRQSLRREEAGFQIMRLLERDPNLSQRELADSVGLSLGGVNYILRALIARGLVKLGNFRASEHKGRYAYILTPLGAVEKAIIARRFLELKLAEYEALEREIRELNAEVLGVRGAD